LNDGKYIKRWMTNMQKNDYNYYKTIIDSLLSHDFIQSEKLSINLIKENPLNAQGWLYLAESLAFQGFGQTAEKVFQRAWLLDPQAAWIDQAQVDLKKADLGKRREDIERLLEFKKVSVSAAMIVKDEETHISNCLKNLVHAVDEIVIVDTGCKDNTIEIAKSYPNVKIVKFEWCDDFSAARNAAFPHITSDWVIWIDADEYLYEEDIENILTVASIYDNIQIPVLFRIGHMNIMSDGQIIGVYDTNRMFPIKHPFKFYSRIHEQVVLDGSDMYNRNAVSIPVKIRVYHEGYDKSKINFEDKLKRNIRLLEKMVKEEPDNPSWLFFYGRELYTLGKIDEGIANLLKAEECARKYPSFGRVLEIHSILANAYLSKQDFDEAEEVCLRSMKIRNDFPNILYAYARIKLEKSYRLVNEAEELVIKSKKSFETYRNIVSPDESLLKWRGDLVLSDIFLCQGKLIKALEGYKTTLEACPEEVKKVIQHKLDIVAESINIIKNSY
jgi:glycosyltransferase involved in cell wall biosynthesis